MNRASFLVAFLMLLALYGCATAESVGVHYDPTADRSSFESDRIVLGYRDMSSGLVSNQRVMWQALASCSGKDCIPDEVTLAFFNDTSRDLNLDYRRLQVIVDGVSHDWRDLSRVTEPADYRVPQGEFLRVSLAGAAFVKVAHAQQVEVLFGETGTSTFTVSFGRRAGFRAFVEVVGLVE